MRCLACGRETSNTKYCSKSCSASRNNRGVRRHGKAPADCAHCSKHLDKSQRKYCSRECQHAYESDVQIALLKSDKFVGFPGVLRKYLILVHGPRCQSCSLTEWMGSPVPLEVEHIDGDSGNNAFSNLALLCPNCHALTPTYKAKNYGRGRHSRKIRYREGKSF